MYIYTFQNKVDCLLFTTWATDNWKLYLTNCEFAYPCTWKQHLKADIVKSNIYDNVQIKIIFSLRYAAKIHWYFWEVCFTFGSHTLTLSVTYYGFNHVIKNFYTIIISIKFVKSKLKVIHNIECEMSARILSEVKVRKRNSDRTELSSWQKFRENECLVWVLTGLN